MADEPKALIYATSKGSHLELRYESETMWLSQKQISELFGVSVDNVSLHLKNIYAEGELEESATTEESSVVQKEGNRSVTRTVKQYNLDAIISVGYRVSSKQGTVFRKWATSALVQLATKGFVVDSDKLKGNFDRVRELREIIRDIRSDEANMYAELRRICAMCQDYDPASKTSRDFFSEFQNRMLYAVTSHTAASIIKTRANAKAENMGLSAWKGDHVVKSDTEVAKNYLGSLELQDLNRLVGMVLDFFEDQAERGFLVSIADAESKLVEILKVNKRLMLMGFGTVKAPEAKKHAHAQYIHFKEQRRMKEITELNEAAKSLPKPGKGKKSA